MTILHHNIMRQEVDKQDEAERNTSSVDYGVTPMPIITTVSSRTVSERLVTALVNYYTARCEVDGEVQE